jgi:hypothetical protein
MLSNPGGASSASIVCEYAKYGAWNNPKTTLYILRKINKSGNASWGRQIPKFPIMMKPARYNKQRSPNRRQLCYPIFGVHIPIIPHIGINVAKTLVTINYISCFVDQNNVSLQCLILTISFVLTFQYFWIYQNPSVPTMDGKACASPIYVVVKNEKST